MERGAFEMNLREELKEYFKENGEEMWDYEYHINEVVEIIEKKIDEQYFDLKNDKTITNLDSACGWNHALDTIKELLKK
jgi:hypothetical protein